MSVKFCAHNNDPKRHNPLYCLRRTVHNPHTRIYYCVKGHTEPRALSAFGVVAHLWIEILLTTGLLYLIARIFTAN